MQVLLKEWNIIGSKMLHYSKLRALNCCAFPNYISFTTSLISASQQKLRILCWWALPRAMHVLHTGRVSVVTGLPFDQMEPSHSMQHRSGNPKFERDFPDFWMEFFEGFYEWVNVRLMTNNYKQYFASSWVYFGLLFQTYFKSSRAV